MIVFSPSTGRFYAAELQATYAASGTWPADAAPVTNDVWQTFIGSPPSGKAGGTVDGSPGWVDAP